MLQSLKSTFFSEAAPNFKDGPSFEIRFSGTHNGLKSKFNKAFLNSQFLALFDDFAKFRSAFGAIYFEKWQKLGKVILHNATWAGVSRAILTFGVSFFRINFWFWPGNFKLNFLKFERSYTNSKGIFWKLRSWPLKWRLICSSKLPINAPKIDNFVTGNQ